MNRRLHRVSLEALRVLDAIERLGSFAAAAQELHVVTSALTHVVRNLEEQLGLTVFDRSGRKARFTREGRLLLDEGRELLAHAAAFDRRVQVIATGWEPVLTLSVDQIIRKPALMPLVQAFLAATPQTSLVLRHEAVAGSWDALMSGRADLVIGAPDQGPPGGGFESLPLYRTRFVLAVAPDHPLAGRSDAISPAELAEHRSVVVGDTTRSLPRLSFGLIDHRLLLSVPDTEAKLDAILHGIGCGFLPERLAAPHVKAGRLQLIEVETPHPPSQNTLAWRAGENGRALRWWIDRLTAPGQARKLFH